MQGDDADVISETKSTLAWVLDQSYILLHPIMPYITEDLWNETSVRTKLLTHADWPTYTSIELLDEVASVEMNWVIALIEQIRSVRAEMRVNAGAKIPMIQLSLDATAQTALNNNKSMIMRLARVDKITTVVDAPKGAVTLAVEGGQFCLPLADIIDIEAEKNRLNKAIEKSTLQFYNIPKEDYDKLKSDVQFRTIDIKTSEENNNIAKSAIGT